MSKNKLLAVLAGMLFAATSYAVPISYTYSGSWTSFSSGDFGPTYSATMVFNNGGATIANQVFVQADFVSATVVSGAYNFTMTAANVTGWFNDFESDAAGQLGAGWFNASSGSNNWHFDTWVQDANFSNQNGSAGYFSSNVSEVGQIDGNVPEPATLVLLGLGLAGVGFSQRKNQR